MELRNKGRILNKNKIGEIKKQKKEQKKPHFFVFVFLALEGLVAGVLSKTLTKVRNSCTGPVPLPSCH